MNTILQDIHPALHLSPSKRARRMALRLDSKARIVKLIVPERASINKAIAFAQTHQAWIAEKLNELPEPINFTDGVQISLFGVPVTLDIYYDETLKRTDITLNNNILSVRTNKADPSARIVRFLKHQIKNYIEIAASEKADKIGKTISAIQIRDTKSRWGSCSPDGKLSFSWRLIFAPLESLDYVIAHEVAHLRYMDHSKKFWALCETLCNDYKAGKGWMRQNAHSLHRYQ